MIKGMATLNDKATNIKGQLWTYKGIIPHADGPSIRLNGHTIPLSFFERFENGFTWLMLHSDDLHVQIFVTDENAFSELFTACLQYVKE